MCTFYLRTVACHIIKLDNTLTHAYHTIANIQEITID